MRSAALLIIALVLASRGGCIGGDERAGSDTEEPDTAPDLEDGLDRFDSRDPTTTPDSDDVIDSDDADTAEVGRVGTPCVEASDCEGELAPCEVWTCPGGACEVGDVDGGKCDDGDACTGSGTCVEGVCEPGTALSCDEAPICQRPICDPVSGCASEPVEGGYCDSGDGLDWGTCDGQRMAPIDICEAGACIDRETASTTPIPRAHLLGDWFVVLQAATDDVLTMLAGLGHFTNSGNWSGLFKSFGVALNLGGEWCLDAALGVMLQLSSNTSLGQVNPSGTAMAATGKGGNQIVVGVRPDATISDVDGTYLAVLSGTDAGDELEVMIGYLVFVSGCLDEESVFHNHGHVLGVIAGACLSWIDDEIFTLTPEVHTFGEATLGTMPLRGSGSQGGDVLVFDREDGGSLDFGMLVALRAASAPIPPFSGRSRWVVVHQEKPEGASYRSAIGALVFDDTTLVNGILRGEDVRGERVAFDDLGRFVIKLETTGRRLMWSGYLSPQRDFGFYYRVERVEDWTSLDQVSEEPLHPSLGFIVRRDE